MSKESDKKGGGLIAGREGNGVRLDLDLAGIYIGLGDGDRAFEWLEKAYIDRSEWLIYLNIEHMFDPIRNDPGFADLVKKVGLPN